MLLASVVLAWAGCTPEDHYETLSLFFNDPPKPKVATTGPSSEKAPKTAQAAGEIASLKFVHRPYSQGKCQACHGEKGEKRTVALDASRCVTCHEMAAKKYMVMHTAVTDMACLWCHAPHQSNQPALLRAAAPALCLQCHDVALLGDRCGGAGQAQSDCA
jgi:predicted CXXCH cytochrome family protein